MKKCSMFILVLCLFLHLINSDGYIVRTTYGDILGRESATPNGKPFHIFQGVPYAAPPLGNLRLANPQEHTKWTDVKDCSINRDKSCLQVFEDASEIETEDCLVLNIYTPKLAKELNESNLAVMVYFHGGGFFAGNSSYDSYGPEFFMDRDVVLVAANYRLGAFGFLSTEDDVISGNFGLKDQQFSLKWVQENIRAFGGDPEKVTIFGNSAGSASVGYQILNMKNKGLFRGAIMSSGSPLSLWAFQEHPKKVAYLTAKFINNSEIFESSTELLQFLRSVPASDLRRASFDLQNMDPFGYKQFIDGYYYSPTVEYNTSNGFLLSHPYNALQTGEFLHVPLVIGINSEEQLYMIRDGVNFVNQMKSYDSNNKLMVSNQFNIADEDQKKEMGRLIYKIYSDGYENLENNLQRGIRFFSDQKMNLPVLKHAYFSANFAQVYLYQFSYHGLMGGSLYHVDGAEEVIHSEDVNYIWRRNLPSANNTNLDIFPESDLLVQQRLLHIYTNFAKYLNPTFGADSLFRNISWPTVNPKDGHAATYLDIGTNLELKTNLKDDTFSQWDELYKKYAKEPYNVF